MQSTELKGPPRPPRSTKPPKESSGLLMSVIRTLSASQNNAERDREKAKLEKDYKRSDQRLDDLVEVNKDDLTVIMQKSSKISLRIMTTKEKIQSAKEKLITCKKLLHCKRDELKKLWLESVEHKHVLHMLNEIEGLVEVPGKLEGFLNKKHYLHATQLLVSSISLLEGSLEGVDALKDLKGELYTKREHLHDVLAEELHKQLYVKSTSGILKNFRRQGSDRRPEGFPSTPKKATVRLDQSLSPQSRTPKLSWEHYKSSPATIDGGLNPANESITEDISCADPEENTPHFVAILVECVVLLNRIPETVEIIKERCQRELLAIVRRTSQHVSENTPNASILSSHQPNILDFVQNPEQQYLILELLILIFEQFHCVAQGHQCVLNNLQRTMASRGDNEESHLYDMADIWSKIQAVLEILIGEYLDIHNTTSAQQPTPPAFTDVTTANDMNSYFMKRRNIRQRKFALFKFDGSSHAISMKTYLQEQKDALKEKGEIDSLDTEQPMFVCQPSARNIAIIFKPLMKFVNEIEQALNVEVGVYCPLHTFLTDCVKVFLGQVNMEVSNMIDSVTKNSDISKAVADLDGFKSEDKPLLQSTSIVYDSLKQLEEFIHALPIYSNHFLHIIYGMLQNYKEACQSTYRIIVQPESEDKRIISSTWAKDKDVSRLLRSLPNWTNLQEKENHDFEESPEEVRLRNKKESEILTGNLAGDTLIPQHEILSDVVQLHTLAQLQESMQWFSSQILVFSNNLPKQQSGLAPPSQNRGNDEIAPVPENMIESLEKLSKEFEDLADTCLLVLHLEVRVHCFYYLLPVAVQGSYANRIDSQEPDPEVVKLNKDLSSIDEAMASSLQSRKIKYIFEGLGELIATILINCASNIKRINENGVKKMCRNIFAIQQNLTSITMSREVALDRARQYFELFYHTPEEILNMIVENGPQFQELEYSSALHLLHRSKPGSDTTVLNRHLERLQDILNEVAVSV